MSTLRELSSAICTIDDLEGIGMAIEAYNTDFWSRPVILESIPLDALVFAEWQQPYLTIEEYREKRCKYDEETNEWLERYVREMAASFPRPIIVTTSDTGIVLVDGCHRTSALLMFTDRTHIDAWVIL